MVFGFSKVFVIFLFLAVLVSFYYKSWVEGASIMLMFAIVKVIWNILTK